MKSVFKYKCLALRFSWHLAGRNNIGHGFNYKIDNTALEFVSSYRDLGITVNKNLKFHCHVRELFHIAAGLASNLLHSTLNRSLELLGFGHFWIIVCVWIVGYVAALALLKTVQRRWKRRLLD